MPDRAYTDADLDAAIAAITDPQRLLEAQDLVARAAPALQRVLASAIAAGADDLHERIRAVRTLLAEETRLGMLVGVAVGFELARELGQTSGASTTKEE